MTDIQRLIDALANAGRRTRSEYHLTLGQAIKRLGELAAESPIRLDWIDQSPGEPMSYRGYYSDLAFDFCDKATVGDFLKACKASLGKTFEGYKGGDFIMGEETPLWAADYGNTGRAIMDIRPDGAGFVLVTKDAHA